MQATGPDPGSGEFVLLFSNVSGWLDSGIAIAASRCGETGVLNCEGIADIAAIRRALDRARRFSGGKLGIAIEADSEIGPELLTELATLDCITLVAGDADAQRLALMVDLARASARRVLIEVTDGTEAERAERLPIDGLVARGQEAGGSVGEETTFVLLQRLIRDFSHPVWAHGGVGLHSIAACVVAGAVGAVLDSQALLLAESSLPPRVRAAIERMEGDETITLGRQLGALYRLCRRPGMAAVEALQEVEKELSARSEPDSRAVWCDAVRKRINWRKQDAFLWPIGQDSAFAAPLAARFRNVSGLARGLRESIASHVQAARDRSPLAPNSAFARAHGIEFPVFQGPMTRVSDTSGFASEVAKAGGLPFLALALLRGPQVRELLAETSRVVGNRPWGVGILGFVPPDLRAEQLEVTREFRPPFAIIAGGRPDQAASLERDGTVCYLHVPAPALLEVFIRDGARRFIFEGRECGGHIGPRTSFVLWESMIEVLQRALDGGIAGDEFHVVFAGGIHDARSTAMVAAMAGPLAARGARIGVLMGTAYLFCREAVHGGAILQLFQDVAIGCGRTVVLETGPGHATRCAETPFYDAFVAAKQNLIKARKPHEEVREELEQMNLGRLRVASKGITQSGKPSGPRYVDVSPEDQRREGMYMIGQVAALRDRVCSIRELHEEVSGDGERYLQSVAFSEPAGMHEESAAPEPCDVAIVGMSCVLPGAPDVQRFWANLLNKVDAITEVPRERFDIDLYYDPDRKARDKIYTRWGGFIDSVPFEPLRYGIPPTALGSIDPMQLLSLILVDRALDDAGYREREFPREKTSVIFGTSGGLGDLGGHYAVRASLAELVSDPPPGLLEQLPEWTEDSFAGLLPNVAAGRVANRFNLGGVNFTVDAACASSLAAVYVAARELTTRSSDMVIVGGVDTVQSPFCFLCFSKAQALSPRGRCRPFDESADGIAISEGITVLVMKRLADAERDGDRIYSVLKAVSGSSDGRGRSMTAPRSEGQKLALGRAYRQAGFSPATVGLMEAHGTGTAAGDATELGSLSDVLREAGAAEHSCAVGSVKSLLGHTKAAAGVTGLMKVALATYYKVLPPTLHVEKPNARLSAPGCSLFVNGQAQPWLPSAAIPRRAGVSSFGFGGTNFHAVVEEFSGDFKDPADRSATFWPSELFVWNLASADVLKASLQALATRLGNGAQPELHELAAAVCQRAEMARAGTVRLALVASSIKDLETKLAAVVDALAAGRDPASQAGVYFVSGAAQQGEIAFLFPGQGSQSPGMLRDLAIRFPEFRDTLEAADRVLEGCFAQALSAYIFPPTAFTPEKRKEQMQAITDTLVAQPALGAVEIALVKLLARLGISPSMTAGHSYGEYVALCAAGVFGQETLFRLSEARGRAIREATRNDAGFMVAAEASAEPVAAAVKELAGITLANYNSPRQTVVAGPAAQADKVLERFAAVGISAVRIPVACAFHSPLVAPAGDRLASALAGQVFSEPKIAVFSNALGGRYPSEPEKIAGVLKDHLVSPVRFTEEIRAMYDGGARVFVETGPRGVLTGLVRQILDGTDAVCIQLDVNGRDGVASLLHALAQMIVRGTPVDTAELFRGRSVIRLDPDKMTAPEPAQWMVNGGHAFRPTDQPRLVSPVSVMKTIEIEKIVEVPSANVAPPVMVPPPIAGPAPMVQAGSDVDALMASFNQLMGQFLQTQAAVTMAYLQGTQGASPAMQMPIAAQPPVFVRTPVVSQTPIISVPPPSATSAGIQPAIPRIVPEPATRVAPKPVAAPTPEVVPARDILSELVRIASERTGYPVEVLDANAAIEADLGIDSIKRVEILSSFQQLCTPAEQTRVQGAMEKLAAAPTLRTIAERINEVLGTQSPAKMAAPSAEHAPAATPSRDILTDLVRIASERTGYPVEVLDANAAIEADLGIDSIKRVEILSSFQQFCTPAEQTRVQAVMEKLAAAPSLRAIADRIGEVLLDTPSRAQPAEPPPAETAAASPRNVLADVVRIASERTGYPVEVLDANAAIEADLGIDSIKRVEILSSFQQLCSPAEQTRVQAVMEKLAAAPTLRAIADRINAALGSSTESPQLPTAAADIPRFQLAVVDSPRRGAAKHYPGRVCLVTDDETGIAAGLAEAWNRAGETVLLLRQSADAPLAAGGVFSGDLKDPAVVNALVQEVRSQYGTVGALIHLLPLRAEAAQPRNSLAEWRTQLHQDLKSFYALVRACESDLRTTGPEGGAMIVAATGRGGSFGIGDTASPDLPSHQALSEFCRTVALEIPEARCRVIDLDMSDPTMILREKVIQELGSGDATFEAGLPGDRRLTPAIQLAPLTSSRRSPIARDWVFLITGGARGITAEVARLIADRYGSTLIIAGASPFPVEEESDDTSGIFDAGKLKAILMERLRASGAAVRPADVDAMMQRLLRGREIRSTIKALKRAGASVEYHAVDVRDEASFGGLIDDIYRRFDRLDVVVHGAGIIEDRLIRDKAPESFDRVVHTKADSSYILAEKLRPGSLRCLLLMSSITAVFGNRGQADYGAANGAMNGFARRMARKLRFPVVAVNWGPWHQPNMVPEHVRRQFISGGIQIIPLAAGAAAAINEIESCGAGEPVVVLGGGPWEERALPAVRLHHVGAGTL
jgi:acyl transferase domain-containing protein/NAD(P)H-dependent flavin oxidoreductase YrpB (nitropropane dioxygenase family)/NAD(P)-dependent dehydrogenase (short-subunit alcohol dehydrogenase family)/acyl carrier protein